MDYNRFEPGDVAVCNPPEDINNPPVEEGQEVEIQGITEQEADIIYSGPETKFEVWYEVRLDDEDEPKLMTGNWLEPAE